MKKFLLLIPLLLLGCAGEEEQEFKKVQESITETLHSPSSYEMFKEESMACINAGGVPIRSAWDGRMKDCKFPPK